MKMCAACTSTATHMHQRHATPEEVAAFAADPDNPSVQLDDVDALVPVYTCDDHWPGVELAARTHKARCAPPCTCTPDELVGQPPLIPTE